MRILTLLSCALITVFPAMPALALECANAGTPPIVTPDDTGDSFATACGQSAVAGGTSSTALGVGADSGGDNSIALGASAISTGESSAALGRQAFSFGDYSMALGYLGSSGGESSTALGRAASSGGAQSVALGYQASAAGANSTALGRGANAGGGSSVAVGYSAFATASSSVAIGLLSQSGDFSSVALGHFAGTSGPYATALGYNAKSSGDSSTALGAAAFADQPGTIILGSIAGVNGATAYANVGMGTSAPSQAVDVERSGAAARFQLTSFTAVAEEAPQYIQRRARGTRTAPTAVQNNDNLGLFSFRGYNGTNMGGSRATITAQAAGNFTGASTPTRLIFATTPVGQTTPQQVLVITPDGKVQVNGVNLNVPDYVFEDDYPLMPLEELRSFIDTHGHLPGIPSADKVNSEGHDLAGSDMAHLRKIEELTLYTLQQQERIDRLEELVNLLMRERDKS